MLISQSTGTEFVQMCTQDYHLHTCKCKKYEEFRQYAQHAGTNVKCKPVIQNKLADSTHYCKKHMVNPGNDPMRR